MSTRIKIFVTLVLLLVAKTSLNAQRIAVTTNALEDIVLTPNVGVDVVVADRQSISFDTSISPYRIADDFHNKRMTFRAGYKILVQPGFLCPLCRSGCSVFIVRCGSRKLQVER